MNKKSLDFKFIFEKAAAGLIVFDINTHLIMEVNEFVTEWLGYDRHEIIDLKIDHLFGECTEDVLGGDTNSSRFCFGQVKDSQCRKKDGTFTDVAITTTPLEFGGRDCVLVFARDISKRKQAERELRRSEERFRAIFEGAAAGITLADLKGRLMESNPALQEMLGYSAEELSKMVFTEFTHPDDIEPDLALHNELVAGKRNHFQMEKRYVRKDGKILWARLSVSLIRGPQGEPQSVIGMVEDITGWKEAQEKLLSTYHQLLEIIEFLPDPTFVIDRDRKVIAWNKAIEEMTGVLKEDIIGKGDHAYSVPFYGHSRSILIDFIFSGDWETEREYQNIERKGSKLFAEAFVPALNNGKGAFVWASASPLFDSNGNLAGAIETVRDVTERNRMKERIQYLATHDSLTGIPNRYTLEENIKRVVAKARRGEGSAVLMLGLDNFKMVNDTLGHAAGDELLITLAGILKENLQEGDLLARVGGDRFAALLEGATAKEAMTVAERLRHAVDERELCIAAYRTCFTLTISVGVVLIDGALDSQRLLSYADTALYTAKENGRNKVVFLKPDEDKVVKISETNRLVSLIKHAIRENRFFLLFQPVIRIADRRVIHYEALVRMQDMDGEPVLPGRFIPVAERFGLMSQVDRWVVQASLSTLHKHRDLRLFINLSGATLGDDDFLSFIEAKIYETGVNPSRIGFEITETAAVKDMLRAERWIHKLKKLGCFFALDDFGIGFSSFSYLRHLPVDYLKIDGSYISNVDTDPSQHALVEAINRVAKSLGKKTIAEFVESDGVFKILKDLKVDYGQGYFLGKPSPMIRPASCR